MTRNTRGGFQWDVVDIVDGSAVRMFVCMLLISCRDLVIAEATSPARVESEDGTDIGT